MKVHVVSWVGMTHLARCTSSAALIMLVWQSAAMLMSLLLLQDLQGLSDMLVEAQLVIEPQQHCAVLANDEGLRRTCHV